jgi:hypothetical protein
VVKGSWSRLERLLARVYGDKSLYASLHLDNSEKMLQSFDLVDVHQKHHDDSQIPASCLKMAAADMMSSCPRLAAQHPAFNLKQGPCRFLSVVTCIHPHALCVMVRCCCLCVLCSLCTLAYARHACCSCCPSRSLLPHPLLI